MKLLRNYAWKIVVRIIYYIAAILDDIFEVEARVGLP